MTSFVTFDRSPTIEEIRETLTLPELQWLGNIIKEGERAWRLSWCEDQLWKKGLIVKWLHEEGKGRKSYTVQATELGAKVYEYARQRWIKQKRTG